MTWYSRRSCRAIALLLGTMMALTACGGDSGTTGANSTAGSARPSATIDVTKDAKAADLLSPKTKSSGRLVVAMDATQGKPFTFYANDNKTIDGLAKDLSDALGKALGVKMDVQNTSFDSLIPGLQAQRYDLSIAPMLMTEKRLQSVDMIGWIHGGSAFMIVKGQGKENLTLANVCGMTVGAVTGSVEAQALANQSTACTTAGKDAVSVKLFPHTTDGIVALTAGRLEAYDTAAAQSAYIAKSSDQLAQSGEPYNSGTSSMALPKDSADAKAIEAALQSLIDSGAYKKILDHFGVDNLAVPSASLNNPV